MLFKPFKLLYKLSGILMTCMLLAGYGVTISSLVYTGKSKCNDTALASVSKANGVVFFILGSLNLLLSHIIIWIPLCRKQDKGHSIVPQNTTNDSTTQVLNPQQSKSDAANISTTNVQPINGGQIPTPTKKPEAADEWNRKAAADNDGIE